MVAGFCQITFLGLLIICWHCEYRKFSVSFGDQALGKLFAIWIPLPGLAVFIFSLLECSLFEGFFLEPIHYCSKASKATMGQGHWQGVKPLAKSAKSSSETHP